MTATTLNGTSVNGHRNGSSPSPKTVAVIGGGLAGITAALDCAKAGAKVTLLESRGRLGGAAYSFTRDGIHADNGQHVFLRCCTEYRALLEEIGASDMVTMQERLDIVVLGPAGKQARLFRTSLPAPLHLARALSTFRFLSVRERLSMATAMQRLRRVNIDDPANDNQSFGSWLRLHRQRTAALQEAWGLISRPTLNLNVDDASLAQAAQVFQLGLLQDAAAGDIGYAHVPLGDIHDVAARRALEKRGVDVQVRRGASRVIVERGGFSVEVSGAPTIEADAVVLAVPPDRAARLLPPQAGIDTRRLHQLGSSPIVNLHVVYSQRVLEVPFAAGFNSPVQYIFDRTASARLKSGQYLAVSLSAADDELSATSEDLRAKYLPALADLLPQARGATVETFFVTREHAATFRAAPGARALRPQPKTQLDGLVLAGTWTDTGWPATMEGAVRSGHAAAGQVLAAAVTIPSRELQRT